MNNSINEENISSIIDPILIRLFNSGINKSSTNNYTKKTTTKTATTRKIAIAASVTISQ